MSSNVFTEMLLNNTGLVLYLRNERDVERVKIYVRVVSCYKFADGNSDSQDVGIPAGHVTKLEGLNTKFQVCR